MCVVLVCLYSHDGFPVGPCLNKLGGPDEMICLLLWARDASTNLSLIPSNILEGSLREAIFEFNGTGGMA